MWRNGLGLQHVAARHRPSAMRLTRCTRASSAYACARAHADRRPLPRYDHPAIEERYASWQTQMLLRARRGVATDHLLRAARARADDVAADVEEEHVLVVTDPLLLPSPQLGVAPAGRARGERRRGGRAGRERRRRIRGSSARRRRPYLTLRELQATMDAIASEPQPVERVTWDDSDPGAFLCRTDLLDSVHGPLRDALAGRDVAISTTRLRPPLELAARADARTTCSTASAPTRSPSSSSAAAKRRSARR